VSNLRPRIAFWDLPPCLPVNCYRHFDGACYLPLRYTSSPFLLDYFEPEEGDGNLIRIVGKYLYIEMSPVPQKTLSSSTPL
jgi:hypothetical protein